MTYKVNDQIISLLAEYPKDADVRRSYRIKPSGDSRPIAEPNDSLNKWLKKMNKTLAKRFSAWPSYMHGGIKRRSYVAFARPHVGKKMVITIDVKQCFDSVSESDIAIRLEKRLKLDLMEAEELASKLCLKSKVAQGYSTSNYLSNLYLLDTLLKLEKSLHKQNIILTNYVDDVAISGDIANPGDVINEVVLALSRTKLKVNKAKIKVMHASNRQVICGLVVNKRLTLTSVLKLQLLSSVAKKTIEEESLKGWLANLLSVDKRFQNKLELFARKKGYLNDNTTS